MPSSRASSISAGGLVAAPVLGRVVRGGQDHVEADQLLDRAVVDRLRHPAAHLALRLHRAPREPARAQAGRRLGGPQQADHHRGGQRGQDEHRLVEGQHVRAERRVAAQGGAHHQDRRSDRGDGQAALLALEVSVRGDQEERGEANGPERVRRRELEGQEQGEVAGGHERADDAVGLAPRDHEHRDRPRDEHAQHDGRRVLVREVHDRHGREGHDRHREARDREHDDRPGRLDRDPAHQAAAACRGPERPAASGPRRRRPRSRSPSRSGCRGDPPRRSGGTRRWRRSRWRAGTRTGPRGPGSSRSRARATTGT